VRDTLAALSRRELFWREKIAATLPDRDQFSSPIPQGDVGHFSIACSSLIGLAGLVSIEGSRITDSRCRDELRLFQVACRLMGSMEGNLNNAS
jgi:hypothetical protein